MRALCAKAGKTILALAVLFFAGLTRAFNGEIPW